MYNTCVGIDIGQATFVVAFHPSKQTFTYPNTLQGFKSFFKEHRLVLKKALVVLEITGGYELLVLYQLFDHHIPVHRAQGAHVKAFLRSLGTQHKTDAADARGLARYAYERQNNLPLFTPPPESYQNLKALAERRMDLTQMLVQEKNRKQSPSQQAPRVQKSLKKHIQDLEKEIAALDREIQQVVQSEESLSEKQKILESIPGIGPVTSAFLLAFLPELGSCSRGEIAALAGVAPFARDSGKFQGYRRTLGGRPSARRYLFLCAMTAARSRKSSFHSFYQKAVARGKSKMVALVALMRKIILVANSLLKQSRLHNRRVYFTGLEKPL